MLPMLLVRRPLPIQRHAGSVVFIASSVRQMPPPAVPTQRRQRRARSHRGEIASADTRPDTFSLPPAITVSGPRLIHALVLPRAPRCARP
jgi:hypothetical protein